VRFYPAQPAPALRDPGAKCTFTALLTDVWVGSAWEGGFVAGEAERRERDERLGGALELELSLA
jgi:hypothetical protein